MKTKLQELLERATPLPWRVLNVGEVAWIHAQHDGMNERIPQKELCHMKFGIDDALLAVHAVNLFPKLVKALDDLDRMVSGVMTENQLDFDHGGGDTLRERYRPIREIIDRANNPETPS